MKQQANQTTIYIGLNDSDSDEQLFETDKYLSVLRHVCENYHVSFSVRIIHGGYFQETGKYTKENTMELILIDVAHPVIMEIAKDLCAFFNQESVMVTYAPTSVVFVKEKI
ncbi:MAG: hypothetical protein J6D18_03645 [Erysipelotrichaceae bacterium]|nr:hypothetical protein [Erysipelotrichaceae bacterium]